MERATKPLHGRRSSNRHVLSSTSLLALLFFLLSTTLSFARPSVVVEESEMIFNRQFLLSLLPFVAARPAATENNLQSRAVTLDQFIASENTYAFNGVFNNIGTK